MKNFNPIRLLVCLALVVGIVLLKDQYNILTARIVLPEKFEHSFYRVLLSLLAIESTKQLILLTYRPQPPGKRKDNFTIGIAHISKVLYGLLAMVLALSLFNISVKEAITSLSLIAAAIVLITKDYISNLINGMYLTLAKVVNVGDQVQIGAQKGKIMDITLTNVHLLNDDDDLIYIPNNTVFTIEIINYTRRDLKKSSIEFEVDPMLVSDIAELERKCILTLQPFQHEIQPGSYLLKTVAVRKDAILLKFQYILNEPLNKEVDKKVRRLFIRELVKLLHGSDLQHS